MVARRFGEISLLRRTARTASARCVSPNGAVLLSLDSVRFQKFLRIAPELSEDFSSLLIHRTSNLLRSFDLFKQVQENKPWSKMEMIASLFEYELAEAGQLIYAPGDAADRFYVIASGCVRIESRWAGMQTLHSQAAFGAMEIMKNWQNDKAHKAEMARWERRQLQRQQAEAEERKRNPDFAAPPAAAAVAPPTPPSPLFRTHTARAVELCGLMWMSLPSFRSLLTLAPEVNAEKDSALAGRRTNGCSENMDQGAVDGSTFLLTKTRLLFVFAKTDIALLCRHRGTRT